MKISIKYGIDLIFRAYTIYFINNIRVSVYLFIFFPVFFCSRFSPNDFRRFRFLYIDTTWKIVRNENISQFSCWLGHCHRALFSMRLRWKICAKHSKAARDYSLFKHTLIRKKMCLCVCLSERDRDRLSKSRLVKIENKQKMPSRLLVRIHHTVHAVHVIRCTQS